ncbi:uncharacterized protein [Nicotiana tomentosiformis]|uniref:uncharacterized protein n=1 Tax=Nicotiana tomentosiformis TaxID=4098 RepID=UPI00388CD559
MITAPVDPPAVRPPRGEGHVGKGHPRCGGQPGGGQPVGAPARFYAFRSRTDVEASDAVITCIISICGKDASVLFDPGSTYSYVSYLFAHFLGVSRESLSTHVYVSTPVGDSVVMDRIYRSCIITFCGYETRADLLLLELTDFEIILGMDWLSPYHAILDCHAKIVTLSIPALPRLEWKGLSVSLSNQVIYFMKAQHMVDKDTQPISIPPYCMAPKELKEKLEDLLAKEFVRPNVSPWGVPVLFVKKKDGTM